MIGAIEIFTKYLAIFPILGACIAFLWGVVQFLIGRSREIDEAQFKRFHEVIRKIQHDVDEGKHTSPYIEIQIAAIYELRFLTRYHPVSEIYLIQKKDEWEKLHGKYKTIGIPTIDSTLQEIKKGTWRTKLKKSFSSFHADNPFI